MRRLFIRFFLPHPFPRLSPPSSSLPSFLPPFCWKNFLAGWGRDPRDCMEDVYTSSLPFVEIRCLGRKYGIVWSDSLVCHPSSPGLLPRRPPLPRNHPSQRDLSPLPMTQPPSPDLPLPLLSCPSLVSSLSSFFKRVGDGSRSWKIVVRTRTTPLTITTQSRTGP